MAWYYESSILPAARWFTYLLAMKYRKENIFFVFSILFTCASVSTVPAQFMPQRDEAGQLSLLSHTAAADPIREQSS